MDTSQAQFTKELKQWVVLVTSSTVGSVFALFILLLLASDGFSIPDASTLDLVCVGLTFVCPIILALAIFRRKRFVQMPDGWRVVAVWSGAFVPLPALISMGLSVFGYR